MEWTDMVEEVSFGRLNLSRAPEAVLQAAFDEAITAINAADSIAIDPAGRLLLTTTVYSLPEPAYLEGDADGDGVPDVSCSNIRSSSKSDRFSSGKPGTLCQTDEGWPPDHPGDQRAPIDRSVAGGIPIWKMLELTDGPSTGLRPTLSKEKLEILSKSTAFEDLVDVNPVDYVTYFECYDADGEEVLCTSTAAFPGVTQRPE